MKYHDGFCQAQPCAKEHHYLCPNCDERFIANADTQYTPPGKYTLPTRYWPGCSPLCLDDLETHALLHTGQTIAPIDPLFLAHSDEETSDDQI